MPRILLLILQKAMLKEDDNKSVIFLLIVLGDRMNNNINFNCHWCCNYDYNVYCGKITI